MPHETSTQFHQILLHYPDTLTCFISEDGDELLLASPLRDEVVLSCRFHAGTLSWSPNWGIQALEVCNDNDYTVITEVN